MEYQDDDHTLSVPRGASDPESKRPYRQLPRELAPDYNLDQRAIEKKPEVSAWRFGTWRLVTIS